MKRRRRVALLIESSRAYGRGLFRGIAKFVREHHEWSVQSEEWKWTDRLPAWLRNWDGDGVIGRIETASNQRMAIGRPRIEKTNRRGIGGRRRDPPRQIIGP